MVAYIRAFQLLHIKKELWSKGVALLGLGNSVEEQSFEYVLAKVCSLPIQAGLRGRQSSGIAAFQLTREHIRWISCRVN